jgi:hypothetical protein
MLLKSVHVEGLEIAGWPRPGRTSWPRAAACDRDWLKLTSAGGLRLHLRSGKHPGMAGRMENEIKRLDKTIRAHSTPNFFEESRKPISRSPRF